MSAVIDFASRQVEGGYFLLNRRVRAPFIWRDGGDLDYEIVGTVEGSDSTIRDALVDLIRKAERRVFIASFLIGDDVVIAELLRAAARLRGGVYVITALDEISIKRGLSIEDEEGIPPEERQKDFRRLTEGGVYVRGHGSCHAKFAVADEKVALVGSANFVRNSFEVNNELSVIIHDKTQVKQATRLFTDLWFSGCEWEVPPGSVYRVAKRSPDKSPVLPDRPRGFGNELVWTNELEQSHLLEEIQRLIDDANRELTLATYSIVGMTENHSLVFEHLQRAIQRGVAVRLHLRQRNARPNEMIDVLAAAEMGVQIHGDIRNHAKAVIADRRAALVFSANLDANHGLTSGVEAGVRLENAESVARVVNYFDYIISTANTKFVQNPTLAELDDALSARWYEKWSSAKSILVQGPYAKSLRLACDTGVCLFEKVDDQYSIFVGDVCAKFRMPEAGETVRIDSLTSTHPADERLKEWMIGARSRNGSTRIRGFCPARIEFAT